MVFHHTDPENEAPDRTDGVPAERVLGVGEDPLAWTFPLARIGWLRLRVHVFVPLWVGAELIAWLPHDRLGLLHVAALTASLLILAVVREVTRTLLGHALGAETQPVSLWPLGGLTAFGRGECRRPVLAETGGLIAGIALVPILGGLVVLSGAGLESLVFNPFRPGAPATGLRSVAQVAAWWAFYANAVMLGLNLLLPMSPLDAGRIVRSWLNERHLRRGGSTADPDTPLRVGLVVALGVFIFAATAGEPRMMALAAFGAMATYFDRRRLEFRRGPTVATPLAEEPPPAPALDEVLAKISRQGLDSLSAAEREVLVAETARRRQET